MKALENIIATLSIALTVWFGASCFEVISKNTTPNPEYSDWNIFEIIEDWANEEV